MTKCRYGEKSEDGDDKNGSEEGEADVEQNGVEEKQSWKKS